MQNAFIIIISLLGVITLAKIFNVFGNPQEEDSEDYPASKYEDEKDYETNPLLFARCINKECRRLIRLWGGGKYKEYTCEYCGTKQRH